MNRAAGRMLRAWIGVMLLASPVRAAVTIDKVLPFTPAIDGVRILTTLKGDERKDTTVELRALITPAGKKDEIWRGAFGRAEIKAGSTPTFEKTLEKLPVDLWSPATPNLYELTVVITQNGKTVATKTARFGFRTVESLNGNIHLNGRPIFLRGLAINPPGRTVPDAVGESRQFAYDYVKYLRGQNVNIIRLEHDNQDWFDVCDELGMMVYQGFYGSPPTGLTREEEQKLADQDEAEGKRLPKDFERSFNEYKDRFETYLRHPSVVIYVLSNEMPYKREAGEQVHAFLSRMYDRLRQWDSTRLYIGNAGYGEGREGDINDVHRYWGWYYNTFLTYYNLRDSKLFGEENRRQPFTFSECVGNFTGPDGAYNCIERKQLAAALNWTGTGENQPELAQAYQAFMVREACESFRRMRAVNPRISGIMPFTITFHNWRGIKSFSQMKPTAAARQLGVSYQPVLLSWENWQPHLYAGAKAKVTAHVINDSDDFGPLRGARLKYALLHAKGQAVANGDDEVPQVAYYETWSTPIEFEIAPGLPSGEYKLVGQIERDGKILSKNDTTIFVAGQEWKQRPTDAPARRVLVFDAAGASTEALRQLGLRCSNVNNLSSLHAGSDLLVLGEGTWNAALASEKQQLAEFVRAGGRVLCLGQEHGTFDPSWLPAAVEMNKSDVNDPGYFTVERPAANHMHINSARPDHPVFAGIDRQRLRLWSDYTGWDQTKHGFPRVYPVEHGFRLAKQENLSRVAILADYDAGLAGAALCEMFDGKGSVLLCGFDLVRRRGLDPVSDRMLSNLVRYMAGSEAHSPHPLITEPIVWADFATQKGVISGPINGLFYNTEYVAPPTEPNARPTNKNTGWNTRPSDQWKPQGVRPRGPFSYTFNCSPRDGDKSPTGSGIFFARVPEGKKFVLTKVRNPTDEPATLEINVNDAKSAPAPIPPGKTIAIKAPIPSGELNVGVRYTGSRDLVILETDFQ